MTERTIQDVSITIKYLQLVFSTIWHCTGNLEALTKSDVDLLRRLALYLPEAVGVDGVRVLVIAEGLDTATPLISYLQTPAALRGECRGRGTCVGRGYTHIVHSESCA